MSYYTRRRFIGKSAALAAGTLLVGGRRLYGYGVTESASSILEESIDTSILRRLATQAVDAARAAGTTYSDIRIGQQQTLALSMNGDGIVTNVATGSTLSYGINSYVNGAWGFVHGITPSTDAVVAATRSAVAKAKGYSSVVAAREFVSASPSTGEWSTIVKISPFEVPIGDQLDKLGALTAAYTRVPGIKSIFCQTSWLWSVDTRVFASTEGSLTTQIFTTAIPSLRINSGSIMRGGPKSLNIPMDAGYEAILQDNLEEDVKSFAEHTVSLARLPLRKGTVGRYPVTLDSASMGELVGATLAPAFELDRILRYEADGVGTSYLPHPEQSFGEQFFPRSLNVISDRSVSNAYKAQWDDEGVAPEPANLIQDGRVSDYITTRQTIYALERVYAKNGKAVRSNGCAISMNPERSPMPFASHVKVTHDNSSVTMDDLIKDIGKGIVIYDANFDVDQGIKTGQSAGGSILLWVERGEVVARLDKAIVQFNTERFWKSLNTMGGGITVSRRSVMSAKGQPPQWISQTVSAPAAQFKSIDLSTY